MLVHGMYCIVGNFRGVIFSWILIINHIRREKIVVSESIIANHTCASLVRGGKIRGFVLTTKSTKILPSKKSFLLYDMTQECTCNHSVWRWTSLLV